METDGEEKERSRKDTAVFPTGGGEDKIPENMEALYSSMRSWGT